MKIKHQLWKLNPVDLRGISLFLRSIYSPLSSARSQSLLQSKQSSVIFISAIHVSIDKYWNPSPCHVDQENQITDINRYTVDIRRIKIDNDSFYSWARWKHCFQLRPSMILQVNGGIQFMIRTAVRSLFCPQAGPQEVAINRTISCRQWRCGAGAGRLEASFVHHNSSGLQSNNIPPLNEDWSNSKSSAFQMQIPILRNIVPK